MQFHGIPYISLSILIESNNENGTIFLYNIDRILRGRDAVAECSSSTRAQRPFFRQSWIVPLHVVGRSEHVCFTRPLPFHGLSPAFSHQYVPDMSIFQIPILTQCVSLFIHLASQPGQVEDLPLFGASQRQSAIRRSARSGTVSGPVDPKSMSI